MMIRCFHCEGDRISWCGDVLEDCPVCDCRGFMPAGREDIADLVDEIRNVLTPLLQHNPDIEDALADAHPRLVDIIMKRG